LTFTDRTPYPQTKEQAYKSVLSMRNKADGSGNEDYIPETVMSCYFKEGDVLLESFH